MYTARELMAFSPTRTVATRTVMKLADWLHFEADARVSREKRRQEYRHESGR
jgi:hypothetical protein